MQIEAVREEPPPPAPPPGPFLPAFYFPRGRPPPSSLEVDDIIAEVERVFTLFPQERAGLGDMSMVAKVRRAGLPGGRDLGRVGGARGENFY